MLWAIPFSRQLTFRDTRAFWINQAFKTFGDPFPLFRFGRDSADRPPGLVEVRPQHFGSRVHTLPQVPELEMLNGPGSSNHSRFLHQAAFTLRVFQPDRTILSQRTKLFDPFTLAMDDSVLEYQQNVCDTPLTLCPRWLSGHGWLSGARLREQVMEGFKALFFIVWRAPTEATDHFWATTGAGIGANVVDDGPAWRENAGQGQRRLQTSFF